MHRVPSPVLRALVLLLLPACAADKAAPADTASPLVDLDGDGFDASLDCDDQELLASPAMPELCDGIDNDCDGQIDEDDAVDVTVWLPDADGDGFGAREGALSACDAPSGYTDTPGDCDDSLQDSHPGAVERCDGLDNDCDGVRDEDDAIDATTWYADEDQDGYGDGGRFQRSCQAPAGWVDQPGDCNESDADLNPGSDELCDGIDNNCDGSIDQGDAVDATRWYGDADLDGHGDPANWQLSCLNPGAGWSRFDDDCDDNDSARSPSNDELCDGLDNDCDGVVDPDSASDAPAWHPDLDGDGYGDSASSLSSCAAPNGWMADDSDCDDSDATTHPAAAEICADGVDNDCDGQADSSCGPGGLQSLSGADAIFLGEQRNDRAGWALAAAGDIDGDGASDLLIGAPEHSGGRRDNGAVYWVRGPTAGTVSLATADATLLGVRSADYAGSALCGPGDVDGDGLADIAVGAWAHDEGGADAGAVFLVTATPGGSSSLSGAQAVWVGEASGDFAGASVAGAGDTNADGLADLLIGATGNNRAGTFAGAVYLVTSPAAGTVSLHDADATWLGEAADDRAGEALAGAGDVDGDGHDDLLIGAWGNDSAGLGAGAAYLVLGPTSGVSSLANADAVLSGEAALDYAGRAVAGAGDINSDGYDDLLVSARSSDRGGNDSGTTYLVLGPLTGARSLAQADAALLGEAVQDYAGYSVAGPGDVNGDGHDDLLIGAHYQDAGGSSSGAAYLVYGPVQGTHVLSAAEARLAGEASGDEAGRTLAGAGDLDGDGLQDLLVGAPMSDSAAVDAGAAYLVFGGPGL